MAASAARMSAPALMVALAVLAFVAGGSAQLQYGFYKGKCNASDVEAVVQGIVKARFAREAPIVAYLLRLQFHECAVNVRSNPQLSNQATPCINMDRRLLRRGRGLTWQRDCNCRGATAAC